MDLRTTPQTLYLFSRASYWGLLFEAEFWYIEIGLLQWSISILVRVIGIGDHGGSKKWGFEKSGFYRSNLKTSLILYDLLDSLIKSETHKRNSLGLRLLWFCFHCFVYENNIDLVEFHGTRFNDTWLFHFFNSNKLNFPSFSNYMLLGSLIASANLGGRFIEQARTSVIFERAPEIILELGFQVGYCIFSINKSLNSP